jgi:DNA-binding NarL/FixJ family response regulator
LILRLSKGLTNKEIGLELDLSEINVKMHMRALFSKLGVKNRTQAALRARDLGFDK